VFISVGKTKGSWPLQKAEFLMAYEKGMSIAWENRKCIVHFRGNRYELPGEFETFMKAQEAGMTFCRSLGWTG
jgi:hypothetical protein